MFLHIHECRRHFYSTYFKSHPLIDVKSLSSTYINYRLHTPKCYPYYCCFIQKSLHLSKTEFNNFTVSKYGTGYTFFFTIYLATTITLLFPIQILLAILESNN